MAKLGPMRLRRWGAVAAAALVVAGCGRTVAGQASVATPALISSATVSPTSTAATSTAATSTAATSTAATSSAATTSSSTSLSVDPFPTSSGDLPTTPTMGSTTDSTSTTTTSSSTAAAPSTTVKWLLPLPKPGTEKVNKYGNAIAAPGQSFAIQWRSNKQIAVVFVVDSLQVDKGCEVPVKAKNGHMLVITMRAQLGYSTGRELSDDAIGFTGDLWTAFDAKDTAQVDVDTSASDACVSYDNQVPYADAMEQGTVYTGKIALDVSSATGSVVLMSSLDGGWLYHYG